LTGSKINEVDKFREIGFPNGEKYADVARRVNDFLKEIESNHQSKHIVIVGHSGIWKALEHIINGKALNFDLLSKHAPLGLIEYVKKKSRIPNPKFNNEIYVGVEPPKGDSWVQDSDTLDTWFSSGLWTFSTLLDQDREKYKTFEEWVANSPDLKKYHPTSVMETGYDILFFWVARMILMTAYVLGEIPFEKVYLHGMVRDKQGRKMSKSLGNGIDPVEMIDKYGADALRLSMIVGSSPGNDIRLYEEKIAGYRNFVNKFWNISRYIIQNPKSQIPNPKQISNPKSQICYEKLTLADKWVLSKFSGLIEDVTSDLDNYRFSPAGEKLRDFTWDDFADWYIEISKIEKNKDEILIYILTNLLKLWHPFIPFITEQIWQEMGKKKLLMAEKWPEKIFSSIEPFKFGGFENTIEIIRAIRNVRAENNVEANKKIGAVIYAGSYFEMIKNQEVLIKGLRTGIEKLEIKRSGEKIENAIPLNVGDLEIYLMMEKIDKKKEIQRTEKEIEEAKRYITTIKNKLDNKQFVNNAPLEIVEKEREKLKESEERLKKMDEKIKSLLQF